MLHRLPLSEGARREEEAFLASISSIDEHV